MIFLILCVNVCGSLNEEQKGPEAEVLQEEDDEAEKTAEEKEEDSEVKTVHIDQFITLYEEYRASHGQQIEGIELSAMREAEYKTGDMIELTGYMKQENISMNSGFSLYGTIVTDDLWNTLHYFTCASKDNRYLVIPVGTEVTVRGRLEMDEGFPYLADCTFLMPVLDQMKYESNISALQEENGKECVVTGAVMEFDEYFITDDERNTLSEKDTPLSYAIMQATNKGVLSDGENEITFFVINNKEIKEGDKITVKGVVSQEDGLLFVNAGEAIYKYR